MILVLLVSLASADIPPPDATSCEVGQACTLEGQAGTCVQKTRVRATPNGAVESPYTACQVGPAPEPKPEVKPEPEAKPAEPAKTEGTAKCQAAPISLPWSLGLLLLAGVRRRR